MGSDSRDTQVAPTRARRAAAWWGRSTRTRILLYLLGLLGALIPATRAYATWVNWPSTVLTSPTTPSPSGTLLWFQPLGDQLIPLDTPEPGAIGIDFTSAGARQAPTGHGLIFARQEVSIARVQGADPAHDTPDTDSIAKMLIASLWADPDAAYTIHQPVPGVYQATYLDRGAVRANSLRLALRETPLPLGILLAAVLLAECAAAVCRRVRLPGPTDCQACGYPLADLPDAVCPECGTPRPPTAPHTRAPVSSD